MAGVSGTGSEAGIRTINVALPHYRPPADFAYPKLWGSH